jgi:Ethanolamine utilization protein EutJ (predicted chaperonin)
MGLLRSLWQLSTLVVAGPVAVVGFLNLLDGQVAIGGLFIGLALAFAGVSEYAYARATGGTLGRLRDLRGRFDS